MSDVDQRRQVEPLTASFEPLFERIRLRSLEAERQRRLLHDEVRWLAEAGFTALRVPSRLGGRGASISQLFDLLVGVAAANSNLAQILRHHFFQVELAIQAHHHMPTAATESALRRIADGELLGAVVTEPHGSTIGQIGTRVLPAADGEGYVLEGDKIYTTGALYADRIAVVAVDASGQAVTVQVPTRREGVTIRDDWEGFGQRLTATGTASFRGVRVRADEIVRDWPPAGHGTGFHQLVLLATLAGIVDAATHDTVLAIRERKRVAYSGTGQLPRHDPIVQEFVGKLSSSRFTLAALVSAAASHMDAAFAAWRTPEYDAAQTVGRFRQAELQVFIAQVTGTDIALWATSHAMDVLGASSLSVSQGMDRHWRNARSVASHNPHLFKARLVGDNLLNGTAVPVFRPGHDIGELPRHVADVPS